MHPTHGSSFDSNFTVLNQIFDSNPDHIGVGVYDHRIPTGLPRN